MIRIERPREVPRVLQTTGKRRTTENCESYDCHPNEYIDRSRKFKFYRGVYGHKSVKLALWEAQYKKCCYCESKMRLPIDGAIDHFRPKGAVQQSSDDEMKYPGYFWLAYYWSNLLVSCNSCNTMYKRNLFPLADDAKRARSHHDDLDVERPLFVDPGGEDPRQHIRFRRAEVIHLTERGRVTIKELGLGESNLEEARRERLDHLEALRLSIPSFNYQMTPKTSLNTRCSISISENLSINGQTRSSDQLGIWSYNINP